VATFVFRIRRICYNVNEQICLLYEPRDTSDELRKIMTSKKQFEIIGDKLLVRAPAKINLTLLIAGKRPDGFHEIRSLMAKINYYDELLIEQGRKNGIELVVQGPEWAPAGKENLAYRACEMLLRKSRPNANIKLTLTKNIPAGSGLGSGSSDAAATLLGVNKFLKLGFNQEKLTSMAASLGSDAPFFLNGPLAFCTGKGEKIEKIGKKFDFLALLVLPGISVSTKEVYNNYNHNNGLFKKLNIKINSHIRKNRIDLATKMCANALFVTCFSLHRELAELKVKIESLSRRPLCLTGSGSAMYCILDNANVSKAQKYQRIIAENIGCKSIVVSNNRW